MNSQDCFYPPDKSILYSIESDLYTESSVTGFATMDELKSGSWQILSSSENMTSRLVDNSGRLSTIEISGSGALVVESTISDLSTNPTSVSNCVQSFTVRPYVSRVYPNPDLSSLCPVNMVVILDESGSIGASNIDQSIRNGVMTLGRLLADSESKMSIVSFDSKAARVPINGATELQEVNSNFLNDLDRYLKEDYRPITQELRLIGGTNWQEALEEANQIAGADLIVMLTDGNPTFYSIPNSPLGAIAGEGNNFDVTALKHAQDMANVIKQAGKHLFVIGIDIPVSLQPIIDISGTDAYHIGENQDAFYAADYITVEAAQIESIFAELAVNTCGRLLPTLGEWGVINLCFILLIIGVVGVKNNNRSTLLSA